MLVSFSRILRKLKSDSIRLGSSKKIFDVESIPTPYENDDRKINHKIKIIISISMIYLVSISYRGRIHVNVR